MFKNYFVVAYRSLLRHKMYSTINIVGLATGLAVCLLIFLFVQNEVSYDQFITDSDRIHRVTAVFATQQVTSAEARLTYAVADLMENDFPEIEDAVRLIYVTDSPLFTKDEERHYVDQFYFADSTFLEVMDLPLVAGDRNTALDQPSSIVLTESIARKYFGTTDILGETIQYNGDDSTADFTVTGVLRDLPGNTHLAIDMLASAGTMLPLLGEGLMQALSNWGWPNTYTFLKLNPGTDAVTLAEKFPEFMTRNEGQEQLSLFLEPLTDIHLHSRKELEMKANGDINQVYTMSAIAILILLIACINFMNLATARASLRSQEVGMRKVVGARRTQLVMQFLGQSILMVMIATALSIVLVEFALGPFNMLAGKSLSLDLFRNPAVMFTILGVGLIVGMLAGLYPALYLSGTRLNILGGGRSASRSGALLRKGLVVFQFSITIILVVATGIVYSQMNFASSLDVGYDRDQIVVLTGMDQVGDEVDFQTINDRMMQHADIESTTISGNIPTEPLFAGTGFRLPGMADDDESHFLRINQVAFDFFETFGIGMASGRSFTREFTSDSISEPTDDSEGRTGGLILNESGAVKLGFTVESAIGQTVLLRDISFTIVGIANDIYFSSVRYKIEPLAYFVQPNSGTMSIRVSNQDLSGALEHIDGVWAEIAPGIPISRSFLDERFNRMYDEETRIAKIITSFSLLAVLIACMGLMGLAAFTAETRRREIGVRKVLGASVKDVVVMLSSEFGKLVLIANIIAWPAAYFLADRWLEAYAYRTSIGLGIFIIAGLLAFVVAYGTVGYQARRAAVVNPVNSIRD